MARRVVDAGGSPADVCAVTDRSPVDGVPEPGAAPPSSDGTEVLAAEHYAGHLRESASSMFHYAAMAPALKGIDMPAYKVYRDRLLADCGRPRDPIEVMIIEQLSMAHLSLGLLSCKTTNATGHEAVKVYSGAAARLMGEFRRSALALPAYRHASRQLARDPSKDLALPAGKTVPPVPESGRRCADDELIANEEAGDGDEDIIPYTRPEVV